MPELKSVQEYGAELERRLRLKTFPLAPKFLETEQEIPAHAKRPLKDFGHHPSLCQVLQMCRRSRSEGYRIPAIPFMPGVAARGGK